MRHCQKSLADSVRSLIGESYPNMKKELVIWMIEQTRGYWG